MRLSKKSILALLLISGSCHAEQWTIESEGVSQLTIRGSELDVEVSPSGDSAIAAEVQCDWNLNTNAGFRRTGKEVKLSIDDDAGLCIINLTMPSHLGLNVNVESYGSVLVRQWQGMVNVEVYSGEVYLIAQKGAFDVRASNGSVIIGIDKGKLNSDSSAVASNSVEVWFDGLPDAAIRAQATGFSGNLSRKLSSEDDLGQWWKTAFGSGDAELTVVAHDGPVQMRQGSPE